MKREYLDHVNRLLRPHAMRLANMVVRGVVQLANDAGMLQLLQVGALFGESIDNVEHFQPYGFSSTPLEGAEAIIVFPAGDRSHPIAIGTPDRRYRPTGGQPGDVNLYHSSGSKVTLMQNGDIQITPAPGQQVLAGGSPVQLALKSDVDALAHYVDNTLVLAVSTTGTATAQSGTATVATTTAPPASGTSVLKGE